MQTSFFEIGGAIRNSGLRPSVHIAPPISQNSVRIYRCVLARLTAFHQCSGTARISWYVVLIVAITGSSVAFLLDGCKIFWLGQIIQSLSKNSVWAFLTHIFHVLCYLSDFETSRLVIHQDGCNAPIAKFWRVQMYPLQRRRNEGPSINDIRFEVQSSGANFQKILIGLHKPFYIQAKGVK